MSEIEAGISSEQVYQNAEKTRDYDESEYVAEGENEQIYQKNAVIAMSKDEFGLKNSIDKIQFKINEIEVGMQIIVEKRKNLVLKREILEKELELLSIEDQTHEENSKALALEKLEYQEALERALNTNEAFQNKSEDLTQILTRDNLVEGESLSKNVHVNQIYVDINDEDDDEEKSLYKKPGTSREAFRPQIEETETSDSLTKDINHADDFQEAGAQNDEQDNNTQENPVEENSELQLDDRVPLAFKNIAQKYQSIKNIKKGNTRKLISDFEIFSET